MTRPPESRSAADPGGLTEQELEDLSQAHVAYTNFLGKVECAAMSDDACDYVETRRRDTSAAWTIS